MSLTPACLPLYPSEARLWHRLRLGEWPLRSSPASAARLTSVPPPADPTALALAALYAALAQANRIAPRPAPRLVRSGRHQPARDGQAADRLVCRLGPARRRRRRPMGVHEQERRARHPQRRSRRRQPRVLRAGWLLGRRWQAARSQLWVPLAWASHQRAGADRELTLLRHRPRRQWPACAS
jgi:hypothetical protein